KDVSKQLLWAFATSGVPQQIKTDNGPAYVSQKMTKFFQTWGIQHVTGIPHSPSGQAIIEHAHET
ncbi:POK18 protein, partial [Jacana jacana]|nr:POK18 protein [Jacana jacana]